MSDHADVKPAAPLYWCGHWTSLNVHPCQSCIEEYGKQTAYYRESDYLALVAERDEAQYANEIVREQQRKAEAERDALRFALNDMGLEASVCGSCDAVMQSVRPGKAQCLGCERAEAAEAEREAAEAKIESQTTLRRRARLAEEKLQARVAIEREGIVTVYDHKGVYQGCMGVETWAWMLAHPGWDANDFAAIEARAEKAEAERDEANRNWKMAQEGFDVQSGVMKEVLSERDEADARADRWRVIAENGGGAWRTRAEAAEAERDEAKRLLREADECWAEQGAAPLANEEKP